MKMRNKIAVLARIICALIFLMALTTSCKSKKEALPSVSVTEAIDLLDAIVADMVKYNTLSASMNTQIHVGNNKKKLSTNATLRMIKNDKLQLSFQVPLLGIEAFRLIISSDSLLLINRLNKTYVAENLNQIKEQTHFNYELSNLQALLTGQLFLPGTSDLTEKDWPQFRVEQMREHAFIRTVDKQKINYIFTASQYKIRAVEMANAKRTTTLLCTYDRHAKASDSQLFPMEIRFSLKLPDDNVACDFSFSSVEIDKKVSIDFSIPSKYQRVALAQVIHLIQTLS